MSEKQDLALEALMDFFDAVEAGIAQAKQHLKEAKVPVPDKTKYDMNKIKWTQAEGASGPYERSEDINSIDFKELLKDLEQHDGKLSRDGYFVWKFEKNAVVGRKKRTK
jgi:hypothetical protein